MGLGFTLTLFLVRFKFDLVLLEQYRLKAAIKAHHPR